MIDIYRQHFIIVNDSDVSINTYVLFYVNNKDHAFFTLHWPKVLKLTTLKGKRALKSGLR